MGILATLVVGLIVGALAKLIMPGRDPGGIIITILLGIAGAFLPVSLAVPLAGTTIRGVGRGSSRPSSAP
jgi:uncharacterized membrane protein YeaQ/YmgE (transglycosylase-associated protein family)